MIPRTFPSILGALGETKMVVYVLPSVSGLQAWKDYIPVKGITTENTAVQNTYANDGYQVMSPLEDISTKQAWKDYIPVFEDASYTKAWSTDAGGYIPASGLFSVYSLFANNEQGVWYDPSDLTTLFQDAAGTTPVTAVEQPVGLMLDKSKGLALGPELVTNGDFSSDTWWEKSPGVSISGGVCSFTSVANTAGVYKAGLLSAGYVEFTYTVVSVSSGAVQCSVGSAKGVARTTPGTYTEKLATWIGGSSAGVTAVGTTTAVIDNVSIKQTTGNHAYQTTSANRPTLSARYNLLTKTEQFDDVAWTKTRATATATKIYSTLTSTQSFLQASESISKPATSISYICAIEVKEAELQYCGVALQDLSSSNGVYTHTDTRNASQIAQGTFGSGFTLTSVVRTILSDGYCRIVITATTNTATNVSLAIQPSKNSTFTSTSYTAGEGMFVRNADLRVANDGVGIPAYQRVNTATDYDTVGFPKYLRFNGSSSAMMTNTITPGTDKAQVFAGVRKLSDASFGIIAELSADSNSNSGALFTSCPRGAGQNNYLFIVRGDTNSTGWDSSTYVAPISNVLSCGFDIGGADRTTEVVPRVNGVVRQTNSAGGGSAAGAGNFLAYPLYIGARAGTSFWFNGRLYSMIVRFGSNLTTAQINNTENYVNSKTKAY